MIRRLASLGLFSLAAFAAACTSESSPEETSPDSSEDELVQRADDHYFYDGPFSALANVKATVSLKGHTAHFTGLLPSIPEGADRLPNVRMKPENGRIRTDIVYPIATARPGKSNSRPGTYAFYQEKPYRPDGTAYTPQEGEHYVTWGGFPFIAYNGGIAMHGPITDELAKGSSDQHVWFLKRGTVSGGCNRMMGEHVVEVSHLIGVSMRKVYAANAIVSTPRVSVTVTADYDTYDGKAIDVDYATDTGVVRPGKTLPADKVEMFGSWVASETPDGRDLPRDLKWEGGVAGQPYVFKEHARNDMVCSFAKRDLPALKRLADRFPGGELPRGMCAKKACIVEALRANADAKARCAL